MGTLTQLFDGGTNGSAIDWGSTEAIGAPVWLAGTGAATFTTASPIHGTTSASVRNTAGTGLGQAALVLTLAAGVKEMRGQAYLRVPSTRPATGSMGILYLSSQNDGLTLYLGADGAFQAQCWHGVIGAESAPGVAPAPGNLIRVAVRAVIAATTTVTFAVFSGESTTPLWTASGTISDIASADSFDNMQSGIVQTPDASVVTTVMVDSIRYEDGAGVSSAFLPPEVSDPVASRRYQVWVRTATQWRNLGTGKTVAAS